MDAAEALQELSRPWPDGDNTKSAIARVSRLVGLPYWRAFDIWYHAYPVETHSRKNLLDVEVMYETRLG